MYNRINIKTTTDLFVDLEKRVESGVYFYRVSGYNPQIHELIKKYFQAASKNGIIIENGLKNPDNNNISFYNEQLGSEFLLDMGFIDMKLEKWLPRMKDSCRQNITAVIYDTLAEMRADGKNDNVLKNTYIKFMCWLYYRFERVVNSLDGRHSMHILYEGECGLYQLMFLNVLSKAGCDVILLQYRNDSLCQSVDELTIGNMGAFPEGFCLRKIITEIRDDMEISHLYGIKPQTSNCTNAWISGKIFEDVRKKIPERGSEANVFYNCFCQINGVEDKAQYLNDLYQLQMELKNSGRNGVIINNAIEPPLPNEIQTIKRGNYRNIFQLISGLSQNIRISCGQELQRLMIKAFTDLMLDEGRKSDVSLGKLMNIGVCLLCWIKKYLKPLFGAKYNNEIAWFFYMGGCKTNTEALFCRFLARLPVDVLIFCPDLSKKCSISDALLYEKNYVYSLEVAEYPQENANLRVGTTAYHAERELDTMMYGSCGIYRNQQYSKANSVTLQTMYEEIELLWNQELIYRPGFSVIGDTANIPVIFSKVSGIKDGDVSSYWSSIKRLLGNNTKFISSVPCIIKDNANTISSSAVQFLKNGKLQREKIKSHKSYQYGYLRETVQDYILDKLQKLLDAGIIDGIGKNGMEYTVIATVLNLDKQILRMLQGFDFTKNNPKIVYLITDEKTLSPEDTIQAAFLNLAGFDIVFFVPTGYRCIEGHFAKNIVEEHRIGSYVYDLNPPNFNRIQANPNQSLLGRLFNYKK